MSDSNVKYINFNYIILTPQKFWSRSATDYMIVNKEFNYERVGE